jgi:hypothetical protein
MCALHRQAKLLVRDKYRVGVSASETQYITNLTGVAYGAYTVSNSHRLAVSGENMAEE